MIKNLTLDIYMTNILVWLNYVRSSIHVSGWGDQLIVSGLIIAVNTMETGKKHL